MVAYGRVVANILSALSRSTVSALYLPLETDRYPLRISGRRRLQEQLLLAEVAHT